MKTTSCPYEAGIARSARTGSWDDSAKAHIRKCAHCREMAAIAEWLGNAARAERERCSPPDAGQIWLKAGILSMQAARERALRPLVVAELAVRAALTLAMAAGIIWVWLRAQSLAANWPAAQGSLPQPVLFSAAALATCVVTLLFIKLFQPILE